jgi:transcriptional regulator with XRE-family HTH domain
MKTDFPSVEVIRSRLQSLNDGEIYKVASDSGVPASTLWKIRCGATSNPGLETVRKFFHLLPVPTDTQADPQPTAQEA